MKELVVMQDNKVVTTSLKLAEDFNKQHKHVLESISNLVAENTAARSMFYKDEYTNRGKCYPMYYINRDGFTLLAMGFTGKEATTFKISYIEAFNKMESNLYNRLPVTYKEALLELIAAEEEKEKLQLENNQHIQVIGELQPKADYVDMILKSKSLVTIGQIAKDYGMSAQELNKQLHRLGIQYKQSGQWLLYAKHHNKSYTHSETNEYHRVDGSVGVNMITKWRQKGRIFIYETLKGEGVLPMIEQEEK